MLRVSPLHGALDQTQGFLKFYFIKDSLFCSLTRKLPVFKTHYQLLSRCVSNAGGLNDLVVAGLPLLSLALSLPVCASLLNESGARCARLPVRTDDWHHFMKAQESLIKKINE